MKKVLVFLRSIMTTVAIVSLLLLIAASFSDRISPLSTVLSAYLGLFFPFLLIWNIILLVLWLFFQKWKQVAMSVVGLLICSLAIYTYFPIHRQTKVVPQNCIKVLTYNVMEFEWHKQHTEKKPNKILQYVVEQNPDIVCFQEFMLAYDKNYLTTDDVMHALEHFSYHHIDTESKIAVFSKFPIVEAQKIPVETELTNGAFMVELNVNWRSVMLINSHLESNKISDDERVKFSDMTKDPNAHKVKRFFENTLFNRMTPAFKWRAKQADVIAEVIKNSKDTYVIVCGDFNDTPISYARHKIKGDLVDSFNESGSGMGITFNAHHFYFRIDYIFHSSNMKSYNTTVGKLPNSDHYPLVTYLQMN
ncbi:endonuclease [Candidatus Symbiothrix dinenymphae]|nr:endonuclease [Candidatus Symbiothrix dinenymphae]